MPRTRDWGGLGALIDKADQERAAELAAEPTACPNDGQPLTRAHDGGLYCEFDGWRPDDQIRII